jgi:hypothetical protein
LYFLTGSLFLTTKLSRKSDPCQKVGFGKILSDDILFFVWLFLLIKYLVERLEKMAAEQLATGQDLVKMHLCVLYVVHLT